VTVTGSANVCKERLDKICTSGSFAYLTCDSLSLPFPDNHFDVVISFRLLPHAERWQELIQEMCRVASKAVILDYPDKRSVNIFYDMLFELKKNMEGNTRKYALFTRQQIDHELEKNNFHNLKRRPEFFFPMVVHRKLKMVTVSRILEFVPRILGLTALFGSPIVLRSDKQ
jgi:2-polyprenyl-3-methyl-5-hydroxy-6-metoxy-1,4-benzoquinol methylase